VGHVGARPVRHHGGEGSSGFKAQELVGVADAKMRREQDASAEEENNGKN
jgi:hypothetical protein